MRLWLYKEGTKHIMRQIYDSMGLSISELDYEGVVEEVDLDDRKGTGVVCRDNIVEKEAYQCLPSIKAEKRWTTT